MRVCQAQMLHAISWNCHLNSWRILLLKKSGSIPGPYITSTGEKIPDEIIRKIKEASTFNEGYACYRQLGFGFLDMAWHTITNPVETNISDFESAAMAKTELFPES